MRTLLFSILILSLFSCEDSQHYANQLEGRWNISQIIGDSTIIAPDSVSQQFIFKSCENAYTSNCEVDYIFLGIPTDTATLNITIKENEIAFIDNINLNIPNFTKVFKLKRFYIKEIDNNEMRLERFGDSLQIIAIKQ
jgi:hypothetical protein